MGLIFLLNSSLGLLQKSPIDDYGIFYKGGLGYSESYGQAVRSKHLFAYLENKGGGTRSKEISTSEKFRKTSGCGDQLCLFTKI